MAEPDCLSSYRGSLVWDKEAELHNLHHTLDSSSEVLTFTKMNVNAGNVLGIELDRADKVESVKKKVQAAFGVPTEQTNLIFGDLILKKDSSEIRNDSPLLLRKSILRSSSTPCLSPTGRDFYQNKVFEIVKPTDEEPFAPNNPKGFTGRALGQPGLKRSIRVGETGLREVAAYLLDHNQFAKVPPTALVKATHCSFWAE